jgi:hypothetical protein
MNRLQKWSALAVGLVLTLIVISGAAQEPRQKKGEEAGRDREPPRKGMMKGMMMDDMPMQGMMMGMHGQHAIIENSWEATDQGVFVVRSGQLLKYDNDLKLIKSVDLPNESMPMMHHQGGGADEAEDMPKMKMMGRGRMQQMMARMHSGLPTRLDVTRDALYVSRGGTLLKFSHDLELRKSVDLPDAKPMMCPICRQMMEQSMRGSQVD